MAKYHISIKATSTVLSLLVLLLLSSMLVSPVAAHKPGLGVLRHFASVPSGLAGEGLAIDKHGSVYVGGISFSATDGTVLVFDPSGALVRTFTVPGHPVVAGVLLNDEEDQLFALATTALSPNASGEVVRINIGTGIVRTLATGFIFPNGLASDDEGNLFVTDSFAGTVSKVTPQGHVSVFASGPILQGPSFGLPGGIGANGIAFDKKGDALFVANTGRGTIVKINVLDDGKAGAMSNFTVGLTTPDGIAFDIKGNLYVAANFANQLWVVAPDGSSHLVSLVSTFETLENPASLTFQKHDLYITNLGLSSGASRVLVTTFQLPGLKLDS